MPSSTPDAKPSDREALPPPPPESATNFGLCCLVLLVSIGTAVWLKLSPPANPADSVLWLAASIAVPMMLLDLLVLRVHRRDSTGLDWDRPWGEALSESLQRRLVPKLLGLGLTLVPFALAYSMFQYYQGAFLDPFYALLRRFWVHLTVIVPLYVWFVDSRMKNPRDAYWQLGRLVMGRTADLVPKEIANHFRGWLVKCFFFPFMFVWLSNSTRNVLGYDMSHIRWGNMPFDLGRDFLYFIDLLFCTVGYAMSFRPLDSHIRTAEPTFLGWVVALFCYPPFYDGIFEHLYVPYEHQHFGKSLAAHPSIMAMCATSILLLVAVYSSATVAFGLRFSNLTHRGILTNGPYRWTKHPAYVTKNISWWLTSLPFLVTDGNPWNSVKRCIMLGIINFIYFMRARTEERHLSRDPKYVEYALWMNEYGLLKFLNRIPGIRYVAPSSYVPAVPAPAETADAHAE
jgi:steroid 5-alpha reductase family enzyme